jgi:hypothetical protein
MRNGFRWFINVLATGMFFFWGEIDKLDGAMETNPRLSSMGRCDDGFGQDRSLAS